MTIPETGDRKTVITLLWILALSIGTAVSARLEIPHVPVPYTLQTLMVLLAGGLLGARNGFLSQITYLLAGVLGAPVFAGGAFGPAVLFGPTGGYLLAFPIAAAIVGYLVDLRGTLLWSFISMTLGMIVILLSGTIYLSAFALHDAGKAFSSGFLLFTWWDMLKVCAAAMISFEIRKMRRGQTANGI
jgi:biotin transport system substrate-specific component